MLLAFGMPDELYLWLPASIRIAFLALFAILLVAFVIAIIRAWRRDPAILVAAAFYALVVCFYSIGNPVRIPSWYTIAPAMSFALVAIYGIEEVVAKLRTAKALDRNVRPSWPGRCWLGCRIVCSVNDSRPTGPCYAHTKRTWATSAVSANASNANTPTPTL